MLILLANGEDGVELGVFQHRETSPSQPLRRRNSLPSLPSQGGLPKVHTHMEQSQHVKDIQKHKSKTVQDPLGFQVSFI